MHVAYYLFQRAGGIILSPAEPPEWDEYFGGISPSYCEWIVPGTLGADD